MQPSTFLSRLATSLIALFFKLLYHSFAWAYDWVAWSVSLGKWHNWILSTLPDLPGPTILELGHGTGHLQTALAEIGRSVYGLDESHQMGSIARRRVRGAGYTPHLIRGLAQSLPFQNGTFQQVVATFPPNFIFNPNSLTEIYRILAPGGKLVVLPVAWLTGDDWLERLAAKLFHITGQAPEWNERFLEPFTRVGFFTSAERRNFTSSELIVITARKNLNV
jgi:ubiquinone/menaquinone biosynthesis C-methylase UbiE